MQCPKTSITATATAFIGIAEGVRVFEWNGRSTVDQRTKRRREIEEEFGENCPEYIEADE